MPRAMNEPHPQFQVHDRHPALRGLAVLLLALVFVAAFLATMAPEAQAPSTGTGAIAAPVSG